MIHPVSLEDAYAYLARRGLSPAAAGASAWRWSRAAPGESPEADALPPAAFNRLNVGGMHRMEFSSKRNALYAAARAVASAVRAGEMDRAEVLGREGATCSEPR